MGCSSSRYVVDINTDGQGIDCQRVLNLLKFNDKEVNQLYRCFVKYDLSNDGKLSILEFLTMLDIEETFLTREIFNELNTDDTSLTFKEFVLAVWRYCVLDKRQIAEMIFELFDTDSSRELSDSEIKKMVTAMYGKGGAQHDINRLLKSMNHIQPGLVSKKEFVDSALKNPPLLFPAYHLQKVLQEKVCGQEFWFDQFSRSASILKSPEVQALYQKSSQKKNVTAVTPIQPSPQPRLAGGDDGLVMIDFGAPVSVSEKKRAPIKHAVSLGTSPHSRISPALVAHSSHHTHEHSPAGSAKGRRAINKQHTTGELPDYPLDSPLSHHHGHRAVIPKQSSMEEKSTSHHSHGANGNGGDSEPKRSKQKHLHQHQHHHSSDQTDSIHSSGKHSKSTKNGEEWATASRKELFY